MSESRILPPKPTRHLARLTLIAFLFTFIASRTLVILIMTRRIPDLFLHLGGTHVHHLNYGIFLLSTVAGVLLFARLNDRQRSVCALAYGVGMALTFDEFGMWLHLGRKLLATGQFRCRHRALGRVRDPSLSAAVATAPRAPLYYWRRVTGIGRALLFVAA
jgi:hypothetical protein